MANEKTFFEEESVLDIQTYDVEKTEEYVSRSYREILAEKTNTGDVYQVVGHYLHALKLGWFRQGKLEFPDAEIPDDRYLDQIRLFNEKEEILVKQAGEGYLVRIIRDMAGNSVKTVDSSSPVFGNPVADETIPHGFVRVYEPGRKVNLILPAANTASSFSVRTRSYITYNEKTTGQAGYGYFRYVAIEPDRRP